MKAWSAIYTRRITAALFIAAMAAMAALTSSGSARAQALFTGETGGKGSTALILTANAFRPDGFTTLANFWSAYTAGVHDRVDAFALYGSITALGRTQHYAGVGSNVGILKRNRFGLDVSILGIVTLPFNRRKEASTVLGTFAPIASRPVRMGNRTVTWYGGYMRTEPIGRRADTLFTPPAAIHQGIVGATIPWTKAWSLILEYNPGPSQQNLGFALLYVFPRAGP